MTALVALPAFGYMAVEVGLGRELTETKVLVFGLLLVVPGLLTGFACHAWLARERACGLTGLLGVVYVTPVALFLLPHDFARDARRSYRVPGVDSTTGIGPAVGVGVNGLIQARRHSAQPPSTLAWAIVLGVGTLLAVGWVARMLWATFECQVIDAEADGPARRCRAEPGRQRAR